VIIYRGKINMLDNFTYGQRLELARAIGISEESPDLEKFAEYLAVKEDEMIDLEDKIYDLETELRETEELLSDTEDELTQALKELEDLKEE
jgi:septal ring factor EnvC (AmiA/AmiB activator)